MKYKIVIFDLDGTILNTIEDLTDSVNHALKINNLPERTLEEVQSFVGNGIHKLIERAVPTSRKDDIEKVFEDFKKHYFVHYAEKTKPYEGIKELLSELKKKGLLLAVVSNKADSAVQVLCKKYFGDAFDMAIGDRPDIHKKPSTDGINMILSSLNVEPELALFIGDSDVDIQTARNAEMKMIAVAWGFRDADFLIQNGAENIVHSPEQILEYIQ